MKYVNRFLFWGILAFIACNGANDVDSDSRGKNQALFEILPSKQTNIEFANRLTMNDSINLLSYLYFYNGGGLATGDFNNDGLDDLFFVSNLESNRMYLNEGGLKFKDITEKAAISGKGFWNTGCTVVDINADGLLDVYVTSVGDYITLKGHNELYVCTGIENGVPRYEEQAAKYGLDFKGFGTHAGFLDYDQDGDLDVFLLNHSTHRNGTFAAKATFENQYHPTAGDRLLKNDNGIFKDVTRESGIHSNAIGYGLGIAISDFNHDGWPDIYIGNDFHEDDYLYINQKDGTFRDMAAQSLRHTSRFSMGVDIADINNDNEVEIISLDMHPYEAEVLKSSLGEDGYDIFHFKIDKGYQYQYARNVLQKNLGNNKFADIGIQSGVYATDWSWAPLLADYNNDGKKDLFISNGIPKRMNNIDYLNYYYNEKTPGTVHYSEVLENMPEIKIENRLFLNVGKDSFEQKQNLIKPQKISFSNGAIYCDLDNDGDLEIVTNNIDDEAFVYKNWTRENEKTSFLGLQLYFSEKNPTAIGSKVLVFEKGEQRVYENYPTRGFMSSSQSKFTIGLNNTVPDSILLIWPNGATQSINPSDTGYIKIAYNESNIGNVAYQKERKVQSVSVKDFTLKHKENHFLEFNREPFMPLMVSQEGPAMKVIDLNGDDLEDVIMGSAKRENVQVALQQSNGSFSVSNPFKSLDDRCEQADIEVADFDADGDLDVLFANGGNEYPAGSSILKPQLFINEGGAYQEKKDVFEASLNVGACVVADFDGDKLDDVFFGGRSVPNSYGEKPNSQVFFNKGAATFELGQAFEALGFVTDAQAADIDNDGDQDIVLAMEWSGITILYNENGQFTPKEIGPSGWWRHIQVADLDQDGHLDILAGNMGTNGKLQPSESQPIRYYVADMDDNGDLDQILTYYFGGQEVILPTHAELLKQLPGLKKRFQYARDFARASVTDIFGKEKLKQAEVLTATEFRHQIYWGGADGFEITNLPSILQRSTLESSILVGRVDGGVSLAIGGNFYPVNIELGRYDASYGDLIVLEGREVVKIEHLDLDGQIRTLQKIIINGKPHFLAGRNNNSTLLVNIKNLIK